MKRATILLLSIALFTSANAQSFRDMFHRTSDTITAEIVAGFNLSDLMIDVSDEIGRSVMDFKQHPGFNVGVNVDIPITNGFYLKPGLLFATRGGNDKTVVSNDAFTRSVFSAYYLQLPILASFRLELADDTQFQLNLGPYFAVGVAGECVNTIKSGKYEQTTKSPYFYSTEDGITAGDAQRFDCGLSFAAGVLFIEHIYVGVQYDLGLYNIARPVDEFAEYDITNGNFAVQVGYRF